MSALTKDVIMSRLAAGELGVDEAARLLASADTSPARALAVDTCDPHCAIAEFVRRVFPGIENNGSPSAIMMMHVSKLDNLHARVREAVGAIGIDCEARAEALRAFQEVFGNGLPRRIEPDRLAADAVDSGLCPPAKSSKSRRKSRRNQRAAAPKPPTGGATSTGIASQPQNVPSSIRSAVVTVEERKAIFTALDKAGEPIGTSLLYVKVKSIMSEQRLKQVLAGLLNEGCVKRLETNRGPRYSRG